MFQKFCRASVVTFTTLSLFVIGFGCSPSSTRELNDPTPATPEAGSSPTPTSNPAVHPVPAEPLAPVPAEPLDAPSDATSDPAASSGLPSEGLSLNDCAEVRAAYRKFLADKQKNIEVLEALTDVKIALEAALDPHATAVDVSKSLAVATLSLLAADAARSKARQIVDPLRSGIPAFATESERIFANQKWPSDPIIVHQRLEAALNPNMEHTRLTQLDNLVQRELKLNKQNRLMFYIKEFEGRIKSEAKTLKITNYRKLGALKVVTIGGVVLATVLVLDQAAEVPRETHEITKLLSKVDLLISEQESLTRAMDAALERFRFKYEADCLEDASTPSLSQMTESDKQSYLEMVRELEDEEIALAAAQILFDQATIAAQTAKNQDDVVEATGLVLGFLSALAGTHQKVLFTATETEIQHLKPQLVALQDELARINAQDPTSTVVYDGKSERALKASLAEKLAKNPESVRFSVKSLQDVIAKSNYKLRDSFDPKPFAGGDMSLLDLKRALPNASKTHLRLIKLGLVKQWVVREQADHLASQIRTANNAKVRAALLASSRVDAAKTNLRKLKNKGSRYLRISLGAFSVAAIAFTASGVSIQEESHDRRATAETLEKMQDLLNERKLLFKVKAQALEMMREKLGIIELPDEDDIVFLDE